MLLRSAALLSALPAAVAAGRHQPVALPTGDVPATSALGARLRAASRQLDNDADADWIVGFSLKFEKCATSEEYYGSMYGGEENGGDNNNQYNYNGMYQQRLVHYKLCPTGSCGSCSEGADYVIDMGLFVEAFIESKLEAQEQECEQVMENCYYDDEYQCYAQAGLDYCGDNDGNNQNGQGEQFQLEDAARCDRLEVDDEALQYYYYQQQGGNNNNYNYNNNNNGGGDGEMGIYVGPYCSANGKNIFLGTFMDEMCSYPAPTGTFEKLNYGNALPYASESLIDADCMSCRAPGENDGNYNYNNNGGDDNVNYNYNNYNDDGDVEVLEMCERLYEDAGKCESNLAAGVTYYPNTYACQFMQTLKKPGKMSGTSSGVSASRVFTGLFAATTLAFAGVAYVLYNKAQRSNVDLSGGGGGTLA